VGSDRAPSWNNILSLKAVLRIQDVYPGSRILIFVHPRSRIPDSKTATKERGEKKFVVLSFFLATKITKLNYYTNFELVKKKYLG
jgi:hypothetical protein